MTAGSFESDRCSDGSGRCGAMLPPVVVISCCVDMLEVFGALLVQSANPLGLGSTCVQHGESYILIKCHYCDTLIAMSRATGLAAWLVPWVCGPTPPLAIAFVHRSSIADQLLRLPDCQSGKCVMYFALHCRRENKEDRRTLNMRSKGCQPDGYSRRLVFCL
jgi:hypothetical protein